MILLLSSLSFLFIIFYVGMSIIISSRPPPFPSPFIRPKAGPCGATMNGGNGTEAEGSEWRGRMTSGVRLGTHDLSRHIIRSSITRRTAKPARRAYTTGEERRHTVHYGLFHFAISHTRPKGIWTVCLGPSLSLRARHATPYGYACDLPSVGPSQGRMERVAIMSEPREGGGYRRQQRPRDRRRSSSLHAVSFPTDPFRLITRRRQEPRSGATRRGSETKDEGTRRGVT